jgi:hypothetical protein
VTIEPTTSTPAPQTAGAGATDHAERDWWVIAGMAVASASAAVASFSGLRGLAALSGWPSTLAWLLPVTVDAYAMTSARVWLAATTRAPAARRFARANALGAITASIAGNAAYHALHAGLLTVTWPIVVLVGAVPAAVLGLTAHLHALHSRPGADHGTAHAPSPSAPDGSAPGTQSAPRQRPTTRPRPGSGRPGDGGSRRHRYLTDDDLMAAARDADARHRQVHDGRPITRDALRIALRISGPRATELRRHLAEAATSPDDTSPDPTAAPTGKPAPAPAGVPVPDREETTTHR